MISITSGSDLSLNESTPGVLNFHICSERATASSDTGAITAFTVPNGTTPAWHVFECADGEGDWTSTPSTGSGGIEYVLGANYRIGGLSQAKLDTLASLLASQRISIVAELRDGTFYLISSNGATATSAPITSGVGGGGATAIGSTVAFTAQDARPPRSVTVATNLVGITTAAT